MVELYYNSNQFTHLIPVLQSRFENPFAMYDKLADFYHEKGYFVHTPARAYRYQVLLEFAQQEDPDGMELYRELAVYDLYLRENAKSRPVFALDEKQYHDQIVGFYQEEEKNRTYLPGYEEYHARQLQRMIQKQYGTTFQKKRTQARISAACILLKTTSYSLSEIAEQTGYSSPEHFSYAFRQQMGCTPGTYRRRNNTKTPKT